MTHPHLKASHFEYSFYTDPKDPWVWQHTAGVWRVCEFWDLCPWEWRSSARNGQSVLICLLDHCQIGRCTGNVRRGFYCTAIEFRVFFFLPFFILFLVFFLCLPFSHKSDLAGMSLPALFPMENRYNFSVNSTNTVLSHQLSRGKDLVNFFMYFTYSSINWTIWNYIYRFND